MKVSLGFVFVLVGLANGYGFQEIMSQDERSLSSKVVGLIESAKGQMPCGFPSMGIPPMSPLRLGHKEIITHGDTLKLDLLLDNLKLYGLDDFDIVEFKISTISSKITFKFHWHHVHLKTLYDVLLNMTDSDLFSKFSREGHAKIGIKDFVVWGTCKYSLGIFGSNGLRLKQFNLYAEVGDVVSEIEDLSNIGIVNKKINAIVEELIAMAINENTENIARISNDYGVPLINNQIGDRTLGDLLALIGGGGGGEGEGEEKEPCIAPPDED